MRLKITGATIGAIMGALFGELNGMLLALIIFMVIDYITGVLAAIYNRKLNSSIGYRGIIKKASMLLVVIIGHTLDRYVIGNGSVCRTAVIFFYLSNELLSIVENYNKMKLPFPEKLKKMLDNLNPK